MLKIELLLFCYRSYITELQHYESQCESILQEVSGALDFLNGLQHQYISVSTKTNALHEACEDLLTEQVCQHAIGFCSLYVHIYNSYFMQSTNQLLKNI